MGSICTAEENSNVTDDVENMKRSIDNQQIESAVSNESEKSHDESEVPSMEIEIKSNIKIYEIDKLEMMH